VAFPALLESRGDGRPDGRVGDFRPHILDRRWGFWHLFRRRGLQALPAVRLGCPSICRGEMGFNLPRRVILPVCTCRGASVERYSTIGVESNPHSAQNGWLALSLAYRGASVEP
jgi:hypothetical protein